MIKAYYAHCMAIYGTIQEARDIELLERLGFAVLNPNCLETQVEVQRRKAANDPNYMDYFRTLVEQCGALAFRALPDGSVPAGVAKEIVYAQAANIPVFELPSAVRRRTLSVDETRDYLTEIGER